MLFPELADLEERIEAFIETLPCRAQKPYPEVEITKTNEEYAKMLLDAFADGAPAEMTAITQYFHHYLVMPNPDIANLELCIALVEMEHLEILGEIIEALGGNPRYWRANKSYWSGGNVAYGVEQDTAELLRLDIEAEKVAIIAYERLIEEIDDPCIKKVLRRIVEDEKVHLKLFRQALQHCS